MGHGGDFTSEELGAPISASSVALLHVKDPVGASAHNEALFGMRLS